MIPFWAGVLAGISAFYTLLFCIVGMLSGQWSFATSDFVQRLDSLIAAEVRP
jgi:hypothetical protein